MDTAQTKWSADAERCVGREIQISKWGMCLYFRRQQRAVFFATLFIVFSVALLFGCSKSPSTQANKKPSMVDTFYRAQGFVKERLKAPASARFALPQDSNVAEIDERTFAVFSYVTYPDDLGTEIKNEYICTVRYEGNDKWNFVDLKMTR